MVRVVSRVLGHPDRTARDTSPRRVSHGSRNTGRDSVTAACAAPTASCTNGRSGGFQTASSGHHELYSQNTTAGRRGSRHRGWRSGL